MPLHPKCTATLFSLVQCMWIC